MGLDGMTGGSPARLRYVDLLPVSSSFEAASLLGKDESKELSGVQSMRTTPQTVIQNQCVHQYSVILEEFWWWWCRRCLRTSSSFGQVISGCFLRLDSKKRGVPIILLAEHYPPEELLGRPHLEFSGGNRERPLKIEQLVNRKLSVGIRLKFARFFTRVSMTSTKET